MEGRHVKLIGILCMLCFLCLAGAIYLFVMFSFAHVWSIALVLFCLFCMLISPGICFGYRSNKDFLLSPQSNTMHESTYLNLRDLGFVAAIVFYILSFTPTSVAWYNTNSLASAVLFVFTANLSCFFAYVLWYVIFCTE